MPASPGRVQAARGRGLEAYEAARDGRAGGRIMGVQVAQVENVVGERVLIAVQAVNISRLSTHPVPTVPGTLIVVGGDRRHRISRKARAGTKPWMKWAMRSYGLRSRSNASCRVSPNGVRA